MPLKMITEIVKEIKENLPADIQQNYSNVFVAKNVTAILEERGFLRKNENGSRLPTQKGIDLGVSTELRARPDTCDEYWQVLYDEKAAEYVRAMLFEEYPNINPANGSYTIEHSPAVIGAGRSASRSVIEAHGVEIALLMHESRCWAYDESALELCKVLGAVPHINANGEYGICIKAEDLLKSVVPILKDHRVTFAVNDAELEIYKYTAFQPFSPVEPTVAKIGRGVAVQEDSGEITKIYLSEKEIYEIETITHIDGTIEITKKPITEKDGVIILHPDSPIFEIIIGKRKGDIIEFNGISYTILSIERNRFF